MLSNFHHFTLSVIAAALLMTTTLQAQPDDGSVGVGLQLGQPSGLSIGVYKPDGLGLDVLAAWDLNDFLYLNAHGVFSSGDGSPFRLFYGPGAYVGLYERGNGEDQVRVGVSATGGLSAFLGPFEIYARVTPRLRLLESTDVAIGGGLGLRLFL